MHVDGAGQQQGKRIRVGEEYQAVPPALVSFADATTEDRPGMRSRKVWDPHSCKLSDEELQSFLQAAQALGHGHSVDQTLSLLYWNGYDTEATLNDLSNFYPHPDFDMNWCEDDVLSFEAGLKQFGKRFHRIAERLPDVPTGSVINFYYRWKITRRVDKAVEGMMVSADREETREGEEEDAEVLNRRRRVGRAGGAVCPNCGDVEEAKPVRPLAVSMLCDACATHWTTWGCDRVVKEAPPKRLKRKAVADRTVSQKDVDTALFPKIAQDRARECEHLYGELLRQDDAYIKSRHVQSQREAALLPYIQRFLERAKPSTAPTAPTASTRGRAGGGGGRGGRPAGVSRSGWDVPAAIQALRKYGKDFEAVARELNYVKTTIQVRHWYFNYRKKFNLDSIIQAASIARGDPPELALQRGMPAPSSAFASVSTTDAAYSGDGGGESTADPLNDSLGEDDSEGQDGSDGEGFGGQLDIINM